MCGCVGLPGGAMLCCRCTTDGGKGYSLGGIDFAASAEDLFWELPTAPPTPVDEDFFVCFRGSELLSRSSTSLLDRLDEVELLVEESPSLPSLLTASLPSSLLWTESSGSSFEAWSGAATAASMSCSCLASCSDICCSSSSILASSLSRCLALLCITQHMTIMPIDTAIDVSKRPNTTMPSLRR